MPRGNGTGPMGLGPMTGRAAGYCAGYGVPGYMNPYGGRMPAPRFGYPGGAFAGAYGVPYTGWGGYPAPAGFFGGGRAFGFGRGRGRRWW